MGGALGETAPVLGEDLSALRVALALHERLGGDAARMVEATADSVDRRRERLASARAATAGIKLSGRLVAGLPLLVLPGLPLAGTTMLDAAGIVLVVAGLALAAAGLVWMNRLVPDPPAGDDDAARLADLLASALLAGVPLAVAAPLVLACGSEALAPAARLARARASLGATWVQALEASEAHSLRALATALGRVHATGLPAAEELSAFARRRRAEQARAHEAAVGRAPVLMVLPLTLCVLPSFVLLGIAPFLRALAAGT